MEQPKSVYHSLIAQKQEELQVKRDNWVWSGSEELKKILESMGVYESYIEQVFMIENSQSKKEVELAKIKLDAIGLQMRILKSASSVVKDSGMEDAEEGITRIEVSLSRLDESDNVS